MKNQILTFLFFAGVAFGGCTSTDSAEANTTTAPATGDKMSGEYPEPWRSPTEKEFIEIGRALDKNKARGCGEYYVRQNPEHEFEYLVGCTPDGKNWIYYQVWTGTQEVEGPFNDADVTKPH